MKRILIILTTIFFIGCSKEDTPPTMYTLSVTSNPTDGGTINPTSGEYEEGTEVTLRVNTNTYFEFDKWSGSWSGSESPLTITMDSNKTLVGNFKLIDTDGDGVSDDIDQCPETRQGDSVDDKGCVLNPIYLDDNGVTIKSYDWSQVGDSGEVNGITYTIVSSQQLRDMIRNNPEDVSTVCTSKIISMEYLFNEVQVQHNTFNEDISSWDVSNVNNMDEMFKNSVFNGDISNWDVSSVTNMESMFSVSLFNGDISNWDVSNVNNMIGMFNGSKFNGDISSWDVSNVNNMSWMFYFSKSFNQDLSNWELSNVTNMYRMFSNSKSFNQDLSSWNVSNVTNCQYFSSDTTQWTLPKPNFTNCNPN